MIISYKGETLETNHWCELSDETFKKLRDDYYAKPTIEEVQKEMRTIARGGQKNSHITNYYVKDLMAKTKLYHSKWSIEDVFECKDLLSYFVERCSHNEKVFPKTNPLIKNIETCLRLGGKGVALKPSNFPIKTVDYILSKYNKNNCWYDFSCGWGARLTGSLKNNVNYFGTDPNYILTLRLGDLAKMWRVAVGHKPYTEIRTQGSELFIPEWEGKMGLAFSSPPYFCLEDYKIGKQSWNVNVSYDMWLSGYMTDTIKNIYRYLISDGVFAINVNNFASYNLVGDIKKIALDNGFEYVTTEVLDNIKRTNSNSGFNDNSEGIMIFKKKK
jgi:hypothetical protein